MFRIPVQRSYVTGEDFSSILGDSLISRREQRVGVLNAIVTFFLKKYV